MSEVDRQIARSREVLERTSVRNLQRRGRSVVSRVVRAAKYSAISVATILVAAIVIGFITPIGTSGIMIAFLAMMAAVVLSVLFSREGEVAVEALGKVDLKRLPASTEKWLHAQTPMLPAPAVRLVDGIGVKLETLAIQLQTLDEREPIAGEIRRLIADDLPELVKGYGRVPKTLRREGLNGMSPDKQLVDGLGVVDSELTRLSEQLASGDLNTLATQGRYLELKYQGDGAA
jgi:hypothetical protein